ncbi:hypothetical protein GCM10009527_098020 [Actinomadura nitritigenes]|uniref:Uncharacterized protein n=1 Tax=Actinomadura nitritigenes TaxID=134602 RepID=A0ABS3QWH2_9ACTN|nr:hypothetical protein [Actinomadura nitritigenes]MBO2438286.1 hypothetical protein [Actinomadura nitritigenes]
MTDDKRASFAPTMRQRAMADELRDAQVAAVLAMRDLAARIDLPMASWSVASFKEHDQATPDLCGFVTRLHDDDATREAMEMWADAFDTEVIVHRNEAGRVVFTVKFRYGLTPVILTGAVNAREESAR